MDETSSAADQEKSVFILKARRESLKGAETFLRSRGWNVQSSTDIRSALAVVAKSGIKHVLICVDHPNPKAKLLPKVLIQAFQARVIIYADVMNAHTASLLRDVSYEYTLYNPVSGPAIERIILRIRKDIEKRESGEISTGPDSIGAKSSFDRLITIRGDQQQQSGDSSLQADDGRIIPSGNAEKDDLSDMDFAFLRNLSPDLQDALSSGDSMPGQEMKAETSGPGSGSFGDFQDSHQEEEFTYSTPTISKKEDPYLPGVKANKRAPYASIEYGKKPKKPKQNTTTSAQGRKRSVGADSIILRGTSKAMDESAVHVENEKVEQIQAASRISCIAVKSPRFSGYLLAAFGGNRYIDPEFLELVRKRLTAYMREHGEEFSTEDSLALELKEVAFEDWAIEKAEFLRKSLHKGNEVALAFFPNQVAEVQLEISNHQDMVSMSVEELTGDVPIGFDVYIYMPVNQKYIRYTAKGNVFYSDQKNRLKSKGAKQIHLRKDSVSEMHRYRVQNFLNDQIASFQRKKTP